MLLAIFAKQLPDRAFAGRQLAHSFFPAFFLLLAALLYHPLSLDFRLLIRTFFFFFFSGFFLFLCPRQKGGHHHVVKDLHHRLGRIVRVKIPILSGDLLLIEIEQQGRQLRKSLIGKKEVKTTKKKDNKE
jgi:hypothetical protein